MEGATAGGITAQTADAAAASTAASAEEAAANTSTDASTGATAASTEATPSPAHEEEAAANTSTDASTGATSAHEEDADNAAIRVGLGGRRVRQRAVSERVARDSATEVADGCPGPPHGQGDGEKSGQEEGAGDQGQGSSN